MSAYKSALKSLDRDMVSGLSPQLNSFDGYGATNGYGVGTRTALSSAFGGGPTQAISPMTQPRVTPGSGRPVTPQNLLTLNTTTGNIHQNSTGNNQQLSPGSRSLFQPLCSTTSAADSTSIFANQSFSTSNAPTGQSSQPFGTRYATQQPSPSIATSNSALAGLFGTTSQTSKEHTSSLVSKLLGGTNPDKSMEAQGWQAAPSLNDSEFPSLSMGASQQSFPTAQQLHGNASNSSLAALSNIRGFGGSGTLRGAGVIGAAAASAFSGYQSPSQQHAQVTQLSHASAHFGGSGWIKDDQPEFQINVEDFPALQGSDQPNASSNQDLDNSGSGGNAEAVRNENLNGGSANRANVPADAVASGKAAALGRLEHRSGIQTSPDGTVTHIPDGMIRDQFGMIGVLTFLRAIESDPSITNLALGTELTTLGLNLNETNRTLYRQFGGPWSDAQCRSHDIDVTVPSEYLTNIAIRDRLAPIRLNRYADDTLFFLFYMCASEIYQLAAAAELYNRDWRYNKEERLWVTRPANMLPSETTTTYERGTYHYFDPTQWRKATKEMLLEYAKLEERPVMPQTTAAADSTGSSSKPPDG